MTTTMTPAKRKIKELQHDLDYDLQHEQKELARCAQAFLGESHNAPATVENGINSLAAVEQIRKLQLTLENQIKQFEQPVRSKFSHTPEQLIQELDYDMTYRIRALEGSSTNQGINMMCRARAVIAGQWLSQTSGRKWSRYRAQIRSALEATVQEMQEKASKENILP